MATTQKLGMNHIRALKQEALLMWGEYEEMPELWVDCVCAVLQQHRMEMELQYINKQYTEQNKDRRKEWEIALEEALEDENRIWNAEIIFNADHDE